MSQGRQAYHTIATVIQIVVFAILLCTRVAAQTRIDIHQINVGNGDGALITMYDNDKLVYTIVVDGGLQSSDDNAFIPYLKNALPYNPDKKIMIDWVILSHNHQDHFNGLVQMFNDDDFIVKEISDQGGYTIGASAYAMPLPVAKNDNVLPYITRDTRKGKKNNPQPALNAYVKAVQTANARTQAYLKKDILYSPFFNASDKTFKAYDLPAVGSVRPSIYFVAGNAFTKGQADRNIGTTKTPNPNNFSIAWIFEYGQFRFYSGGDLGGYAEGYTDQETPVATYLKSKFTSAYPETGSQKTKNYPGHICVMKTNHHGSTKSSNPDFLSTLAYSAIITSAGKHSRWKIPTVAFVDRVAANEIFGAKQGVYFTQLYNYKGNASRTRANSKFEDSTKYNYIKPSDKLSEQYSYVVSVVPVAKYPGPPKVRNIDITKESYFVVYKVESDKYTKTLQCAFLCHKP